MCGIFGVVGQDEAAHLTYLGLHALQHRGEEGAGIVSADKGELHQHRQQGLVSEMFRHSTVTKLKGSAAIGHNRYSTTGASVAANLQPFSMRTWRGPLAVAHNGNLTNAEEVTRNLELEGCIFQSTSDTELILHLMARSKEHDSTKALIEALYLVDGAYSLLVLTDDRMIVTRDKYGLRPLVMGMLGDSAVFASETTALDLVGASFVREIEPGEVVTVFLADGRTKKQCPFDSPPLAQCIFEQVYFSRPDSTTFGMDVHEFRVALGRRLAVEQPPLDRADLVVAVPDSGIPAALGYARETGVPFDMGIIRNHYIGRTFLKPKQEVRDLSVRLKLAGVKSSLAGQQVVVVDDSLVRGTTSRKLIRMLRERGAAEVHLRISAPPTVNPCYYGIDTPTREELIATRSTVEEIRQFVGADTLGYLSHDGLLATAKQFSPRTWCSACFGGEYVTPLGVRKKG
jgi:amidophosphoribosyltransferase